MASASSISTATTVLPVVPVQGTGLPSKWTVLCTGMECAGYFDSFGPTYNGELDDMVLFWGDDAEPPATDVPDSPLTGYNANCTSGVDDRRNHANEDLRHYQVARGGRPVQGAVQITYDDGGTEIWMAMGATGSTVIQAAPREGSLTCP